MRTIEEIKADMNAATTLEDKINYEHELKNALYVAWQDDRCVVLPIDCYDASEFYHVVIAPEWCGENCECEGKDGNGCSYDRSGDCTFQPYVSKVSLNSVYHALYILRGLKTTRESATVALATKEANNAND